MTSSEQIPFRVNTMDEGTEIHLINGWYQRVDEGVGTLETMVSPGVYTVKLKAGKAIKEIPYFVQEGTTEVVIEAPDLRFSSPAPLSGTKTAREYHKDATQQLSSHVQHHRGTGSEIFVFVRDLDGRGRSIPTKGLQLCTLGGSVLVDLEEVAETGRGRGTDELNLWAGCNIAVDPGPYRLRVKIKGVGTFEETVYASPSWQTQVFLIRRPFIEGRGGRRADLTNASINMAKLGRGFDPWNRINRSTDLARQALANHNPSLVPENALRDMLDDKMENPMLGLYGAHLLAMSDELQERLLTTVVANTSRALGEDHPDIKALDIRLAQLGLSTSRPTNIEVPPMLRASWDCVVEESIENEKILPRGSLARQIADRTWGNGAWLVWQQPPGFRPDDDADTEDDLSDVLIDIIEKAPMMGDESDETVKELTPLELGVLRMAQSQRISAEESETEDEKKAAQEITKITNQQQRRLAVEVLGVPSSVAQDAARSLNWKLDKGNS
jgi:hypothetical protein